MSIKPSNAFAGSVFLLKQGAALTFVTLDRLCLWKELEAVSSFFCCGFSAAFFAVFIGTFFVLLDAGPPVFSFSCIFLA